MSDCIVPGCHAPAEPDEPCAIHLAAAQELFAWAWPNGLPPTIDPETARRQREMLVAKAREVRAARRGDV